jgi:hypothetical protein
MDGTTEVTTVTRGDRLRRTVARSAVVLGFAVGGWLVVTGSAFADTAPSPPPVTGSLVGSVGSLVGSATAPLTPVVAQVVAPIDPVGVQVAANLATVVAPIAPVVAQVVAPVTQALTPVTAAVAPVLAPVTAAVAPVTDAVAPVLAPVTSALAPATAPLALPALAELLVAPAADVPADTTTIVPGADTLVGPLAGPSSTATPRPSGAPSGSVTAPVQLARAASPATALASPVDGSAVPGSTIPTSPASTPCPGSGASSSTAAAQLLASVPDLQSEHLSTYVSLASSSVDATLLAAAREPGASPD